MWSVLYGRAAAAAFELRPYAPAVWPLGRGFRSWVWRGYIPPTALALAPHSALRYD